MSKHPRHGAPPPQRNFAPLRPGEAPVYQPLPNHVHTEEEPAEEVVAEPENAAEEVVAETEKAAEEPAEATAESPA